MFIHTTSLPAVLVFVSLKIWWRVGFSSFGTLASNLVDAISDLVRTTHELFSGEIFL